jgi:DNA-binding GntR family transcriptional regulator
MNEKNQKLGYKSLTECVMDYLKGQLMHGEIKPGEEINFKALCETLGVSRTPIREALIQLMKDGFIEVVSRKGFRIKKITLKEIEDLYEIGGLLESEIVKSACDKLTDEDIKKLEHLHTNCERALRDNDPQLYIERNFEFNQYLWSFCINHIAIEFLNKVRERLYFVKKRIDDPEWERMLFSDHREMIRLMKEKNKKALDDLLKNQHWSFSRFYPFILRFHKLTAEKAGPE